MDNRNQTQKKRIQECQIQKNQFSQSNSNQKRYRTLIALTTLTLLPVYSLASIPTLAIPQSATVTYLKPTSGAGVPALSISGQRSTPIRRNQVISLRYQNSVPQQFMNLNRQVAQANVRFDQPTDPIVQIGPSSRDTQYIFPCAFRNGNGTIGWDAMERNRRGCTAVIAQVGDAVSAQSSNSPLVADYLNFIDRSRQPNSAQSNKSIQAQIPTFEAKPTLQYCGALETTGAGWGFSQTTDGSNPCEPAIEECQATGSGGTCEIATVGQELIATEELIASAQCPGTFVLTTEGNGQTMAGSELEMLKRMARSLNSKSCLFHVFHPNDLVISPATDDLTLVQIQTPASSEIAVLVLVGSVNIVSAKQLRGLTLSEGSQYNSDRNNTERLNCAAILNSDSLRSFLTPANWGNVAGIRDRLRNYRTQFCQNVGQSPSRPGPVINIPFPFPFPFPFPDRPGGGDSRGGDSGGGDSGGGTVVE